MILLDTHVLVWMVTEEERLSRDATREIQKAQRSGGCGIASITLWELALLFARRRLSTPGNIERAIQEMIEVSAVEVIDLTPSIAALTTTFPDTYPKDPGDRIIGATARALGIPLITQDEGIRASPLIRSVW